jgi:adenosylmethionine-8-amino-7-oxononanoate aminotransferase
MLGARLAECIAPLRDHPHVSGVRQTGLIAAMDLVADKQARTPYPGIERRGLRFYLHGLEHGMLLRPLGDTVYFLPPYCVTPEEIDRMVETAAAGIAAAVK